MSFESPDTRSGADKRSESESGDREKYLTSLSGTDDVQSPKKLLEAEHLQGTKKIQKKSKQVEGLISNKAFEKIKETVEGLSNIEKRAVRLSVLEKIDDVSRRSIARSKLNEAIDGSDSAKINE